MTSVLGAPGPRASGRGVRRGRNATLYLMSASGPIERARQPAASRASSARSATRRSRRLPEWVDAPADRAWASPAPGDVLRAMDRFHPIPDDAEFAASWAEWLYFNGHTADGSVRFYLTFLVGPASATPGRRVAGVRLQLERDGTIDELLSRRGDRRGAAARDARRTSTSRATASGSTAMRYRIELALPGATGEIALDAAPGRSLPPATIRGARGWVSGYTAPVLSGTVRGDADGRRRAGRRSRTPSAITITTGDSGKACAGSGDRSRTTMCRSSTAACFRRRMSPTLSAFPASSACSAPRARSASRPT